MRRANGRATVHVAAKQIWRLTHVTSFGEYSKLRPNMLSNAEGASTVIYTGECTLSDEAAQVLRGAEGRAAFHGRAFVYQEDLLVELLLSESDEMDRVVNRIPWLAELRAMLLVSRTTASSMETKPIDDRVTASTSLQTCVEQSANDGMITAGALLLALLREPQTHLLKLIADGMASLESKLKASAEIRAANGY